MSEKDYLQKDPGDITINELQVLIEDLLQKQENRDLVYQMGLFQSQFGDWMHYVTHYDRYNEKARELDGSPKDAMSDSFFMLLQALLSDTETPMSLAEIVKMGIGRLVQETTWAVEYRGGGQAPAGAQEMIITFGDHNVAVHGSVEGEVVMPNGSGFTQVNSRSIVVMKQFNARHLVSVYKARAIIAEHGGAYSHAAILARENNIPCVVGVPKVTNLLKMGDAIHLDTRSKRIRIFE